MTLENKKLRVILGLGKTGLACARYLHRKSIPFVINDSRENPSELVEFRREFPDVDVILGGFDEQLLARAEELIVSPGVSLAEPLIAKQIARGVSIAGDIELFARQIKTPIVAITGSNGKSTVTSLLGKMAECAGLNVRVGGNIGIPVLDLLGDDREKIDLYVLELSSFQLETTHRLHAAAAVLLNICPDHLDRYVSMDDYIAAKRRIYKGCKVAVINRDDSVSASSLPPDANTVVSFGFEGPKSGHFGLLEITPLLPYDPRPLLAPSPASEGEKSSGTYEGRGMAWLAFGDQPLIQADELKIKGQHHISNALAALALGHAINLPMPAMLTALKAFEGLPHRSQWFLNRNGVNWYNDSKATNIGAALAAILGLSKTLQGKLILIAGGIAKENDFSALCEPLSRYARAVILLGQDKRKIAEGLYQGSLSQAVSVNLVENMQQAIQLADQYAIAGDIVLLSPFCASLDMFDNFEQRGNIFMEAVCDL